MLIDYHYKTLKCIFWSPKNSQYSLMFLQGEKENTILIQDRVLKPKWKYGPNFKTVFKTIFESYSIWRK